MQRPLLSVTQSSSRHSIHRPSLHLTQMVQTQGMLSQALDGCGCKTTLGGYCYTRTANTSQCILQIGRTHLDFAQYDVQESAGQRLLEHAAGRSAEP